MTGRRENYPFPHRGVYKQGFLPNRSREKMNRDLQHLYEGWKALYLTTEGCLEGELVVPQFVLDELRRVADSADAQRRNRGRRGLDLLQKVRQEPGLHLRIDPTDWPDTQETDVKLLRLARETGGRVVTNDFNLNKVASVSGMKVLNLNDLAAALKPAVLAGEEMETTISKEGKEPGQGVGYMEDGTMIVVEGGRRHVGETVHVVVTTVIQTSAGRMIFSRLKEEREG